MLDDHDVYAKLKDAVTNVFDLYINKPCFGASIEFFLNLEDWTVSNREIPRISVLGMFFSDKFNNEQTNLDGTDRRE